MKRKIKALLVITTIFISSYSYSQLGLEVSPTIGLNSTWIVNPNMLITHQTIRPELTLTGEYGAQTVLKFGKRFGLGVGISKGSLSQRYDWNEDTLSIISLETFNIPVFMRLGNRLYSETGIQFSAFNKGHLTILGEFEEDVLTTFRQNNLYLIQGLGVSLHLTPHMFINVGGRFGYGLYDIQGVSPQGYDYETLDQLAAFINSGEDITQHPDYNDYSEYIGYFESAQSFADNYERFNRTHSFFLTLNASLVINLQKSKDSDN